jgi:hypothetical protein
MLVHAGGPPVMVHLMGLGMEPRLLAGTQALAVRGAQHRQGAAIHRQRAAGSGLAQALVAVHALPTPPPTMPLRQEVRASLAR